ncbi:Hypothetical protein, putative [Bodo saltans]|uniref:Uncharacterized protein n=1 Tax=Bodo saltans TaxID=75058 RepID=A0A0S4JLG8_BODSA|nr:Hypothetical protein, putative [Bodo saltans]|eukprot:CUG89950.1 Hypothetical protein, putative [Bodo saltans]
MLIISFNFLKFDAPFALHVIIKGTSFLKFFFNQRIVVWETHFRLPSFHRSCFISKFLFKRCVHCHIPHRTLWESYSTSKVKNLKHKLSCCFFFFFVYTQILLSVPNQYIPSLTTKPKYTNTQLFINGIIVNLRFHLYPTFRLNHPQPTFHNVEPHLLLVDAPRNFFRLTHRFCHCHRSSAASVSISRGYSHGIHQRFVKPRPAGRERNRPSLPARDEHQHMQRPGVWQLIPSDVGLRLHHILRLRF